MVKVFRKLRARLLDQKKISSYLLYALGEIFLVVVGILIALQINNRNEARQHRQAELRIYENIREQIRMDLQQLQGARRTNANYIKQFQYANSLIEDGDRGKADTLALISREFISYSDFDRQGNIYETLVNSGRLELLKNHEIIDGLRNLEESYLYINRMENIHYDAIMNRVFPSLSHLIKFSNGQVQDPEGLFHFEFQNLAVILLRIMEEKDIIYKNAIDEIEGITDLIATELRE